MSEDVKPKKNLFLVLLPLVLIAILAIGWKNVSFYPWVKALHLIAVISWMAGMLYLPRLFVYHASEEVGSETSEKLKLMELKLLKIIMNPALIVTWICGLWLLFSGFVPMGLWLVIKLVAVIILTGFHGFLAKARKRFAADENKIVEKNWRYLNEVPTGLMILSVVMVIVKPF